MNDDRLHFKMWTCIHCGIAGGFTYHADKDGNPINMIQYEKREHRAELENQGHKEKCKGEDI